MTVSFFEFFKISVIKKVRSRSLNHLDTLEHIKHRQSIAEENALKDSHSEPDCAQKKLDSVKNLLTVPKQKKETIVDNSPSSSSTHPPYNYRRNKLSRSQVFFSILKIIAMILKTWEIYRN